MDRKRTTERTAEAAEERLYARFSEDLGLYVDMVLRDDAVVSVRLSREEPTEEHGTYHPYLTRVIKHLSTGEDDLKDIPVDIQASPFHRQVLDALRDIPPGEVMTYGEVARKLGHPRAARAVGSACARNPVPIIIPCHRVVPASGRLGNYSGGEGQDTKAAILRKEGALGKMKGPEGGSKEA
jgi:methylated-DNA-[protein]-cysteine S-methyltransferase